MSHDNLAHSKIEGLAIIAAIFLALWGIATLASFIARAEVNTRQRCEAMGGAYIVADKQPYCLSNTRDLFRPTTKGK